MTYLEIARSVLPACEKSEKSLSQETSGGFERSSNCEKSEICEKSPAREQAALILTPDEAEQLKAEIIAVVTVDPAAFDRALYEQLAARWNAYEAALTGQEAPIAGVAKEIGIQDASVVGLETGAAWAPRWERHAG